MLRSAEFINVESERPGDFMGEWGDVDSIEPDAEQVDIAVKRMHGEPPEIAFRRYQSRRAGVWLGHLASSFLRPLSPRSINLPSKDKIN